ncbi:Topoisomerase I-related protein [Giardia duodenalis]|uniref:Topoisomerase I-related protein n=1 Tax=Giardia intestinalis (strain ATCC 50803 / WB clone C6) TaxID=184922 RepID=A8BXI7_GIAIC|nr:Topoisomerase I-related protein [Giardia intestinalis]KAE8302576.1 Topoisomerase I-related protein [Giardia intestinalis]|eukprot:XP_001704297.1 Topoisomerase I-related protein [Giardia lamblia ATCC 50803]
MTSQAGDSSVVDADLVDRCFAQPGTISYQVLDAINARLNVLYHILVPTEDSITCRYQIIKYIRDKLHSLFPELQLIPYGSFVTRIFLPDGDIDLAIIVGEDDAADVLAQFYIYLKEVAASHEDTPFKLTNLSKIQAEVPIIRLVINGVFIDISSARPVGLVTSLYLQLLNDAIGRNNLLKRSVILIQAWCLYEAHILGSHSQMLNSYALRVMTTFILTNSPELVHPLQVLFKFFAFYSAFDFTNNTITAFGVVPNSEVDGSDHRALYDYLLKSDGMSQHYISKESLLFLVLARNMLGNVYPELSGCLRRFKTATNPPENISEDTFSHAENARLEILFRYIEHAMQHRREAKKAADKTSDKAPPDALSDAVRAVVQSPIALSRIMPFPSAISVYHPTTISILDPVQPSNNLAKATSAASFARLKAALRTGYFQLGSLMMMLCDKTAPLSVIQTEFDLLFSNTLAHFDVELETVQSLSTPHSFDFASPNEYLLNVSSGAIYHELLNVMTLYLLG